MNIHQNARLTPLRREEMALLVIEGRLYRADAAPVCGKSAESLERWVKRYKAAGRAGMGLRRRISDVTASSSRAAMMAARLQLAPTTWRYRLKATNQSLRLTRDNLLRLQGATGWHLGYWAPIRINRSDHLATT